VHTGNVTGSAVAVGWLAVGVGAFVGTDAVGAAVSVGAGLAGAAGAHETAATAASERMTRTVPNPARE
jgi:hypothetical protein